MRVQYVNGYKIRQELDIDFNILHFRHANPAFFISKWYIPADEIWLDHNFRAEEKFLVDMETAPMEDYSRDAYRQRFTIPGQPTQLVSREEQQQSLTVQYIQGEQVRRFIDPQFVLGGHDLVYAYIPSKTIWIEQAMDERDWPHVILHEIHERQLMNEGKTYDSAHDYASAAEKESRRQAGALYLGDENYSRHLDVSSFYVQP